MTTSTETTTTATEATSTEAAAAAATQGSSQTREPLTAQQQVQALQNVVNYLQDFDRVPGSQASQWAQVIDALVYVANSIVANANSSETQ